MILSVEDLLNLPELKDLTLVSGKGGIDGLISAINTMDNPDTFRWLKDGEFLITSGYVLKENPELIKQIIKIMVDIGCTGLGIKIQRYFNEIPNEIIQASNLYNFPVIEIPYDYSLSYVSSVFYKEVYIARRRIMDQSIEMQEHFTNTVLMGGGLSKISEELALIIQNPVIILDKAGLLLSYSEYKDNPLPLANFLDLEVDTKVFDSEFFNKVKGGFNNSFRSEKIVMLISKESQVVLRIKPIVFTGEINGYIVVWESGKKLNKMDYVTIQQATVVVSMDRLKQIAINAAIETERKDFFDDLLEGRITDVKSLESLSQMHGLNINAKYICMVTSISNYDELVNKYNNNRSLIMSKASKLLYETSTLNGRNTIIINRSNYLISFVQIKPNDDTSNLKIIFKELGLEYIKALNLSIPDFKVSITIGNLYKDIIDLRLSFNEALETLKLLNAFGKVKNLAHYEDFKVFHLLSSIKPNDVLLQFFNNTIGKLQSYDLENNTNLMETLVAFIEYNGNISQAAKMIYVHRNTFIYRIDKIKQLLDSDLKDRDELLELNLAIKAMELLTIS